ncbi:NAD(+) diphosphatase [Novosphingobium sp. FSY-8]|uniref:NAD(+) diphosphatase n=1 Tax=Novosphingobium ovatum TaxID=1908523 RepID=A0ABW9XBE8_9SPHN|nr:NAD(+) diphosphatase [Novosphingobium ovatum]NBC35853.1 NAD(+) diphosphatase [Novosphingobium ovatum]
MPTTTRPIIAFSGSVLDRADALRSDPVALAALRGRGDARLLGMDGLEPVVSAAGALVWQAMTAAPDAELLFLGLDGDGAPHFAPVPQAGSTAPAASTLWSAVEAMAAPDLAAYAAARALGGWHARHRFCAVCGAPTVLAKGGWQRSCTSDTCRAEHFPRTDPVVIMTVEHQGRLLLGRQPRFPAHRYSALAGFVEPGETLEEAVTREIREEAGLTIRDVRYVASQPWPFPASLMFACHAYTDDPAITIDTNELEDARWFTRDEVAEAMDARAQGRDGIAFSAPTQVAVAWHLLDIWLHGAG